jgi:hypothetical protein
MRRPPDEDGEDRREEPPERGVVRGRGAAARATGSSSDFEQIGQFWMKRL